MKTILSAVLFASFLLSGPATVLAGEAETKKEDKKDTKAAAAKGPVKKDDKKTDDAARLRGK